MLHETRLYGAGMCMKLKRKERENGGELLLK